MNDQIKKVSDRLSKALDALCISPDLYRGKVATKPDEANHLMKNLEWPRAVKDVKNASELLKSKGCLKVGVVGFCMGGALSIASAALESDAFDAAICFYGIPPASLANPAVLSKPIQFHFGDKDKSPGFSDIVAADKLRDTIAAAKILSIVETRHEDSTFKEIARSKSPVAEFHRYAHGDHGRFDFKW